MYESYIFNVGVNSDKIRSFLILEIVSGYRGKT